MMYGDTVEGRTGLKILSKILKIDITWYTLRTLFWLMKGQLKNNSRKWKQCKTHDYKHVLLSHVNRSNEI